MTTSSLTLRLALLCEEVKADPRGIALIRGIIADMSPGGMGMEMPLPATIRWGIACWFQGSPGHVFRATLHVESPSKAPLLSDTRDIEVPESGEGESWWPIGPFEVTEPGPLWVSLSFDGTEVWKRAGYIMRSWSESESTVQEAPVGALGRDTEE